MTAGNSRDKMMRNSCKDSCPLKRPVRRPSIGSEMVVACDEDEQPQPYEGARCKFESDSDESGSGDDYSCSSSFLDDDDDDDGDDDATQVTSNQHSTKHGKTSSSSSNNNKAKRSSFSTALTTKSSKLDHQDHQYDQDHYDGIVTFTEQNDDLQSKPALIAFDDEDDPLGDGGVPPTHCLTHERIRSFMVDYYSDWDSLLKAGRGTLRECLLAFVEQYFTEDVLWIRSTGNPLRKMGIVTLLAEDVEIISLDLVGIDSIQMMAGNMAAVVVYTADQVFKYKGKPESDRTTITAVLHMLNNGREGLIKIGHEHRSVGKPIPKCTRWE